jgi:hypothetical protein
MADLTEQFLFFEEIALMETITQQFFAQDFDRHRAMVAMVLGPPHLGRGSATDDLT